MKKFIALIVLLQLGVIAGAKENSSNEGIDILAIKEANINGSETRSESISADITGNTLTITFNDNVGIAHIVVKDSNGVYIRVYQPHWDCASVLIDEQEDLDNYVYGIKKSVIIDSSNNTPIIVEANTKIDIMASEFVSITGPFQINAGAEFSIAMQKCPE